MKVDFEPPLREVTIIVTSYIQVNPDDPLRYDFFYEFPTVGRLANFLSGYTKLARSMGYNIPLHRNHRDHKYVGKISIRYKDRHHGDTYLFRDINHFVQFLKDNPEFAKALGYVPK